MTSSPGTMPSVSNYYEKNIFYEIELSCSQLFYRFYTRVFIDKSFLLKGSFDMDFILYRFQATRQQLERLPRRQAHPVVSSSNSNAPMQEAMTSGSGTGGTGVSNGASGLNASGAGGFSLVSSSSSQQPQTSMAVTSINTREISINSSSLPLAVTSMGLGGAQGSTSSDCQSQFLLSKFMTPTLDENELAQLERDRADR